MATPIPRTVLSRAVRRPVRRRRWRSAAPTVRFLPRHVEVSAPYQSGTLAKVGVGFLTVAGVVWVLEKLFEKPKPDHESILAQAETRR